MRIPSETFKRLILEQLGHGEMRLLSLLVAIRKTFGPSSAFKGDLSMAVKATLRKLVASQIVTETDGIYSLCNTTSKTHVGV
jgi:hypothetical protein